MAEKVRIGIIGVGMIGKHHIRQYKEIPEADIVAVCDLREDEALRVRGAGGRAGGPPTLRRQPRAGTR